MNFDNLRNETVFDYTKDERLLAELVSTVDEQSYLDGLTDVGRAFGLLDYAEYVGDRAMQEAVEREFESELSSFFCE